MAEKIVERKGINAIKPIVAIATKKSAAFWAEKAEQMSKNTLETYVREFKKDHLKENLFEGLPGKESQTTIKNTKTVKSAEKTDKKTTDPDRLYGLCKEHENLAPLGLIENGQQSPQNWLIRTQPARDDPKYKIDLVVQKFRNRHRVRA